MEHELTTSFVAAVGDAYRLEADAIARLAPVLDAHLERARAAWPGVDVPSAALAQWLAERVPDDGDPAAGLAHMATEDLYLACACAQGVAGAADAFERAIMSAVPKAIARIDASPGFVDEVMALVRAKLLVGDEGRAPRVSSYLGRGPLSAFAQVVAIRAAQTLKRRSVKDAVVDRESMLELPFEGGDPEAARLAAEVREPFRRAFGEALSELSPRDRNVLRLYLVEEVGSETIAAMYRVHRATVARWVAEARAAVQKGTRKRLMKELQLGRASVDSLVGKLLSQLDVSLATFLGE